MNKQYKGPDQRGIEWTDYTWNPVGGCKHACRWTMPDGSTAICYAAALAEALESAYQDVPDENLYPYDVSSTGDMSIYENPHNILIWQERYQERGILGPDESIVIMRLDEYLRAIETGGPVPHMLALSHEEYRNWDKAPLLYWSGEIGRARLREIINFIAGGAFRIE